MRVDDFQEEQAILDELQDFVAQHVPGFGPYAPCTVEAFFLQKIAELRKAHIEALEVIDVMAEDLKKLADRVLGETDKA